MDIAKVIVDVPVRSTDRPFDYLIPDSLKLWIEVGSRVAVPFGPRTVQGFVVSLESGETGSVSRMKPIVEVLDLLPPLSPELVELGDWISQRYACRRISALQAMLPTALKGKAERLISLGDTEAAAYTPGDELFPLFLEADNEEQEITDFVRRHGKYP